MITTTTTPSYVSVIDQSYTGIFARHKQLITNMDYVGFLYWYIYF